MIVYVKGSPCIVSGFIVPHEFIKGQSLSQLETTLGLASRRLDKGAVIVQLRSIPAVHELDYYGDTRTPEHRFEQARNKDMSHAQLSHAAFNYIRPPTRLVKVIAIKNPDPLGTLDSNWPAGLGAMQFKLKQPKPGVVLEVIEDYMRATVS